MTDAERQERIVSAYREMRDGLHRSLSRRLRDPDLAEDIVHDVFLRIHDRADQLRDVDRVRGWIARIAHHAMLDALRRRRPETGVPDSLAEEEDGPDGVPASIQSALRAMLDQLSDEDRDALLATEWDGRSQGELADAWGLSVSGAKSRVQRARRKLKELLLDCCHVELDARGRVLDMVPRARGRCACRDC